MDTEPKDAPTADILKSRMQMLDERMDRIVTEYDEKIHALTERVLRSVDEWDQTYQSINSRLTKLESSRDALDKALDKFRSMISDATRQNDAKLTEVARTVEANANNRATAESNSARLLKEVNDSLNERIDRLGNDLVNHIQRYHSGQDDRITANDNAETSATRLLLRAMRISDLSAVNVRDVVAVMAAIEEDNL